MLSTPDRFEILYNAAAACAVVAIEDGMRAHMMNSRSVGWTWTEDDERYLRRVMHRELDTVELGFARGVFEEYVRSHG